MWEDSRYFWVVLCKNHWFHVRRNLFFRHKILLGETDAVTPRPVIKQRFKVRCDECRRVYAYKISEVLRVEQEPSESFTPHPLFRDEDTDLQPAATDTSPQLAPADGPAETAVPDTPPEPTTAGSSPEMSLASDIPEPVVADSASEPAAAANTSEPTVADSTPEPAAEDKPQHQHKKAKRRHA